MSFVSILFFACLLYLANGMPWESESSSSESDEPREVFLTPKDIEGLDEIMFNEQLGGFLEEISKAIEKYLMPMISKLDEDEQEELYHMGMNGFVYYIDYMMYLIRLHEPRESFSEDEEYHPEDSKEVLDVYKSEEDSTGDIIYHDIYYDDAMVVMA